ncbi:Acetyltransferase (GNAT) family protein [Tessaracoccus bendigoensis DSM 12906]|uniref:Acetyltransferase (GNAT) family protein n=1 Tax=Tessaracoccus bendigoensis DSM 12906 TaxID=1123357 RepID=A0A1M6KBF4_9ACTN|nr:GNAT family N-acetyltransferase [Tessaracoccus bendigoensis]SHJ56222.1 Acetyltransferase (GNAT) family protein [Tessaracoccus bendigoensis DSM 12906]
MQISRHEQPPDPSHPDFRLCEFDAELWDGVLLDLFGNTDLGKSALAGWSEGQQSAYARCRYLAAHEDGELAGMATLVEPRVDNRHVAYVSVGVSPSRRRMGTGEALLEAALAWGRANGRTTFQAWTWEPLVRPGPGMLKARDGDGVIDPEGPGARFLLRHGFRLAQVDTMSGLTLQPQATLQEMARAATGSLAERYELLQWVDDTPAEHLSAMAALMVAMSIDVPTGEAELQPEVYDEARVRTFDRQRRDGGLGQLVTVVRERRTGELVGFTRVVSDRARPRVADQWDTLVLGPHRGQGLGWTMKTASHAAMRATWPGVSAVVTGNASENSWMLDINRRLGFVPIAASGCFERREAGSGAD